jgi:hypothetical protein
MIDMKAADELFEAAMSTLGAPLGVAIFDARVAAPLSSLPEMVLRETGETLPDERLEILIDSGWIPAIDASDGNGPGVPLYVPSRVGLLLQLERSRYGPEELRAIAEYEQGMIDSLLVTDELEYIDDDRELLLRHLREELELYDKREESLPENQVRLDNTRRIIDRLEGQTYDRISTDERRRWAKLAFRVRMLNESIRLQLLNSDRKKIQAGYSPMIIFAMERWDPSNGISFEHIVWGATVDRPWTTADGVEVPLRVPGFFLRCGEVTTSQTLSPSEYRRLWSQHELDAYRGAYGKLHDLRRCLNCKEQLAEGANPRRIYCGDRCRDAARQRKWRRNNPLRYQESQRKYWTS